MFAALKHSIVGRALKSKKFELRIHQLRDYAENKRQVDDAPFGGGAGMVLKPEPLFRAAEALAADSPQAHKILLSPHGAQFNQQSAERLSQNAHLILFCGHYEGVDERFVQHGVDEQISVGPYILTGGELAAMAVIDVVARLIDGVVGNPASVANESLAPANGSGRKLKAPVYTRPTEFRGWEVPAVLRSGDHARIAEWHAQHEREI